MEGENEQVIAETVDKKPKKKKNIGIISKPKKK